MNGQNELILAIAGVILSLVFSYVPGAADWYGRLEGTQKRLVMLILLAVAAGGMFGLACAGLGGDVGLTVTCDRAGAMQMVMAFILAMTTNQATYLISPKGRKSFTTKDTPVSTPVGEHKEVFRGRPIK